MEYQRNRDTHLNNSRDWYNLHKEELSERARLWYLANADRSKENNRKWLKDNPDKARALSHNKRARRRKAPGKFTAAEWREVIRKQQGKCFDCGRERPLTVGHLIPIARGGSNDISNIVGQCIECNCKQATKIHSSVAA